MILGVGTDLANIERIQGTLDRFGDRFRNRVFTEIEQRKSERRADTVFRIGAIGMLCRTARRCNQFVFHALYSS